MKAEEIARYLQDNPAFFEEHADFLAQITIPHPHGGRAISITERQILNLREKTRDLEGKLSELIRFGEENDALSEKVHRLCVSLLRANDPATVLSTLYFHLREDFAVPHCALRVWGLPVSTDSVENQEVGEQTRIFTAGLSHPFCGANAGFEAISWFGETGIHVKSIALIPLRREAETIGLLALGSEDLERFYPEMGTLYLERIGDMAATTLVRSLE